VPGVQTVRVGYERYGLRDALDHIEERMEVEKLSFELVELAWPSEGGNAKYDRIQRLEPDHRAGRWHYALEPIDQNGNRIEETRNQRAMRESGQGFRIFKPVHRLDHEGNVYSLNKKLFDQYGRYPFVTHDDVLDAQSRLHDMDPAPPLIIDQTSLEPETYVDGA
jgi:phage terminase large subunit-like protein